MGFLTKAFERRDVSVVGDELRRAWKSAAPLAGVPVTQETALTFSAVFAAHKILAESVAMLPLFLLKRNARGKEPATNKRLYSVLHDVANPEMDAYLVRETLTGHLVGWGRAHAKLDYNADGEITAMWPIPPGRVEVKRNLNRELVFDVTLPDGGKKTYRSDEMLYLRGMSPDGINVYTPIKLMKQGISLALAAESFGASFFGNGASPNGVLESPKKLSDPAYQRLKESWNDQHQGVGNANKMAILEEGLQWKDTSMPNDDAQYLQTRVFQVEEISRWYRIPPSMLAMTEKAMTYASVEAFGMQFVTYTLYPWLVRWEKAISMQMLLERERSKYFAEHLMTALLRGDTPARYTAYGQGRQWGWLSVNDIRELENMNPIENGDIYLTPSNMTVAGKEKSTVDAPRVQRSYLPVWSDALGRVLRRESSDIRAAAGKHLAKRGAEAFMDWLGHFYEEHRGFIVSALMPAALGYADLVADGQDAPGVQERVTESLTLFALRHTAQAQEKMKEAMHEADPVRAVEGILAGWDAEYVERLARAEMSRETAVLGGMNDSPQLRQERGASGHEGSQREDQESGGGLSARSGTIIIDTTGKTIEQDTNQVLEGIRSLAEMLIAANKREQPAPQITFSPVIQPSEVTVQNTVEVAPTPVVIENTVKVPEPPARQIYIKKQGDTWIGEAE